MRIALLMLTAMVAACATDAADPSAQGNVEVIAASGGQQLDGASCTVNTASRRWEVRPPAVVQVGGPDGDLSVVCNKAGFRSSEVHYRPSPYGGGAYPNVGVGIGGGSGGGGVGLGFGLNFPIGGARAGGVYPQRIVVEMTPQ